MKLKAAKVYRAGRTARTWNYESDKVELEEEKGQQAICLAFCLSSKGGGITEVKVTIGADDIAVLVSAMMSAGRGHAMRAMASALATEIAKQPDYDKEIACKARESVAEAASNAYTKAPEGRDHAERLVMEVVRQLVEELNNAEDAATESSEHPVPQKV